MRGVYASAALLNPPADHPARSSVFALKEHQHLLRLDALLRGYGEAVAASHQSAVLAWGLPTSTESLDGVHLVHATRGRTARRRDGFTIHTCELDDVITEHEGRQLVIPPLALIGQALLVGLVPAVASMDAAIVARRTTPTELAVMLKRMRHTPGLGLARRAVGLADGLAESPRETHLRLVLIQLGVKFIAQHWVRAENGKFYRVDFYLPDLGVVLEYDGQEKYVDMQGLDWRCTESGAGSFVDGRRVLAAEKTREDDLRLDGFGVGRVTSSKLTTKQVRAIIEGARRQAHPRALRRPAEPPSWA